MYDCRHGSDEATVIDMDINQIALRYLILFQFAKVSLIFVAETF